MTVRAAKSEGTCSHQLAAKSSAMLVVDSPHLVPPASASIVFAENDAARASCVRRALGDTWAWDRQTETFSPRLRCRRRVGRAYFLNRK